MDSDNQIRNDKQEEHDEEYVKYQMPQMYPGQMQCPYMKNMCDCPYMHGKMNYKPMEMEYDEYMEEDDMLRQRPRPHYYHRPRPHYYPRPHIRPYFYPFFFPYYYDDHEYESDEYDEY